MWITFLNLTGYNDVHLYAPLRSFIRWGAEGLAPPQNLKEGDLHVTMY